MRAPPTRLAVAAALVAALVLAPGCVELSPASLPDRLLEGRGGNGWERNATASDAEPRAEGSLGRSQTLVYEDRTSTEGYDGSLTVTTLRALLRPNEERVRETVQARIREEAEGKGLKVEDEPVTGTRSLKNGETSSWFVYNGSVESATFFQSRNARVKIFGEVFQCTQEKTTVITIGLAQTTDVRSIGNVPLPSDADPTTWREIVADPRGSVEGIRGSDGLAYNVAC